MRLLPRLWVWQCHTCGVRVEVHDPTHLPLVETIHALGRCWEPPRD